MHRRVVAVLIAAFALATCVPQANAFLQFNKRFLALYIEENENEEYVELVKKQAKCLVCHQGRSKKNHNLYGQEVKKLLSKADRKDVDKIDKALKEVSELHTDPENEESPTYGDLIAEGKLPGGDLEDLKKEPDSEEE